MNLIKTIMCKNEEFISCEICNSCKKINHMNHPQKFLSYKPNESKYKIVIINDSNKMTLSSQNTILKILEEPPEYGIIIFISNNSNNLLETIKSRSQIIKFKKLLNDEVQSFLISELKLSNDKAVSIALFSDGIINKAYQAYKNSEFLEIRERIIDYSNQLIFNDKINAIKGIAYLNKEKDNILLIFDIMIGWIRDILIVQTTSNYDIVLNKDKSELIKKNSYKLVDKNLVSVIEKINQTINDLDNNINYKLAIDNLILNIID